MYLYVYWCFNCDRSDRGLELHHIFGRISASALNACPLCNVCHGKIKHTTEEQNHLMRKVILFHLKEHYCIVAIDNVLIATVQQRLEPETVDKLLLLRTQLC